MKKLLLSMFVFALPGLLASAQDITGTWQGTLAAGKGLRTVIKIAKNDGVLKSTFYSIDQGGQAIPVTKTTLDGSTLTLKIDSLDLVYTGKYSADANTIVGTSTQSGHELALTLTRATPETAWAIPEPPPKIPPMVKDADPSFEVATIKPTAPDAQGKFIRIQQRHFTTLNMSLGELISWAYGVHAKQVVGGPDWLDKDHFDISAQPDAEGMPSSEQWKSMVRKLLVERFGLKFHSDKRELAVYALVVAKDGPKIKKSDGDPNGGPSMFFRGPGMLPITNATMAEFAGLLQEVVLDRPVLDKTELTGKWTFVLKWMPSDSEFGGMGGKMAEAMKDQPDAPPGLFTAIQEEDGLKLEPARLPVDVMVVDHVEKPTAN